MSEVIGIMSGRRITPPMAVVKTESDSTFPSRPSTRPSNSGHLTQAPGAEPSSDNSLTHLANPDFSKPPEKELDLPLRMKQMLEMLEETEPARVEIRYNEFVGVEEKLANAPVQEGDQIKL